MSSELMVCELAFVGHMCFDEIVPFEGLPRVAPGSAVLCGALAATRIGTKVAVVTRMAPKDESILDPMRQSGIEVDVIPTEVTTYMKVVHPSADVDNREMFQLANAGLFATSDIPTLDAKQVHLAGITDQEFAVTAKKHGSTMVTSALRGIFKENASSRQEILSLIHSEVGPKI